MAESAPAIATDARFRFRSPLRDETLAEYTTALQTFRDQEEEDDALLDHLSRELVSLNTTPVVSPNSTPVHHDDHPVHDPNG